MREGLIIGFGSDSLTYKLENEDGKYGPYHTSKHGQEVYRQNIDGFDWVIQKVGCRYMVRKDNPCFCRTIGVFTSLKKAKEWLAE